MTCTVSSSAGLIHNTRLGKGMLTTDLRAFSSRDVGAAKAGEVDNRVYAAALGYALDNGHSVMAAYQGIGGATGCPYINNPYLTNYVQYRVARQSNIIKTSHWRSGVPCVVRQH